MADCVYESIPTIVPPPRSIEITQNGDYNVDFLDSVNVNVSGGGAPVLESLSVTENGTYTPEEGVDGFNSVDVNVSGGGGGDELANAIVERTVSGSITMGASLIGDYAFARCYSLTTVNFPNALSIGTSAFFSCISLTTVSFPNALSIGDYAFRNCSSLTTVNFPNASFIGASAFFNCYSLTTASLPNALSIEPNAFRNCYYLSNLYLLGSSRCSLQGSTAFLSTPIGGYTGSTGGIYGSIFVPASLYNSYLTANDWSYFSSRFVSV